MAGVGQKCPDSVRYVINRLDPFVRPLLLGRSASALGNQQDLAAPDIAVAVRGPRFLSKPDNKLKLRDALVTGHIDFPHHTAVRTLKVQADRLGSSCRPV